MYQGSVRFLVIVMKFFPEVLGIVSVSTFDGISTKALQDHVRTELKESPSQIPMPSVKMGESLGVCKITDKKR
jgi:hypothetical protein